MTLSKKLVLTDTETLEEVLNCLVENLSIETQGACDQKTLFEVLIRAASNGDSIENTTKILKSSPCVSDIRYHLDKINNFEQLESQINLAFKSKIPHRIRKSSHKIAIDLNLIPYYGKPDEEEKPYIYRSETKSGTCSFYAKLAGGSFPRQTLRLCNFIHINKGKKNYFGNKRSTLVRYECCYHNLLIS